MTDMSTVEQTNEKRFVRYEEILQWIIQDVEKGKGLPSIEIVDWTMLAAMSQYLFQRYINEQPEASEEVVKCAEEQAEADLYLSLAYAVHNIKRRLLKNELVLLTEVIDFLRDKQIVAVEHKEVDFTAFFESEEYRLVEIYRLLLKRGPTSFRSFLYANLGHEVADRWLERCEESQEELSKLSLAVLSTAALGIVAPTLLYHDSELLEQIYDETEGFFKSGEAIDYGGLLWPVLNLRHSDYAADMIMHGKHRLGQNHRKIWRELYDQL